MQKLGVQVTPTSVSWALVQNGEDGQKKIIKSGIRTFKDAVSYDSSGREQSSASVRTKKKSLRKIHRRKRNRKADLLLVLTEEGLCPPVSAEAIRYWKTKKLFPNDDNLREWLNVNAETGRNPYADRHECLHRRLDLTLESERHVLGRALYHLSQRRGYLDNKSDTDLKAKGQVLKAISDLNEEMREAGYEYLGDYFYAIQGEKKIRSRFLSRNEQVEKEFREICRVQHLDEALVSRLHRCIFRSTPVRSQKWAVGKCVYEKDKPRCKSSHPLSEEFNMWETINNFKVGRNGEEMRRLNDDEVQRILPLFYRKSKPHFEFSEVASALSGVKLKKGGAQVKKAGDWTFNYRLDQNIGGCPVSAAIMSALGEEATPFNWKEMLASRYARGNDEEKAVNDVWHTLEFFDDQEKAETWLRTNLGIDGKAARILASFPLPSDYSALSIKAIRKALPFLQQGYMRYEAILMANLSSCLPDNADDDALARLERTVTGAIDEYRALPSQMKCSTLEEYVKNTVRDFMPGTKPENIWIPNAMETFVPVLDSRTGAMKLGSPQTSSLRNPLVMRCLIQTGQVINSLIDEHLIDRNTEITYTLSQDITTRNMREAIGLFQNGNRKRRDTIIKRLEEENVEVTEETILRYRLWEEQRRTDILSGGTIGFHQVFDGSCAVDHIIPVSLGGGELDENRILVFEDTLRKHGGRLVCEVFDRDDVKEHMAGAGWFNMTEQIEKRVMGCSKSAKSAAMKDAKDRAIRDRHVNEMELSYWKSKISRILTDKAWDDSESLLAGRYGSIGKYLSMYLRSVFKEVNGIGGNGVREFRKMWGIPVKSSGGFEEGLKDAATAACIGRGEYNAFCAYMKNRDTNRMFGRPFETLPLPWETFASDVNAQVASVLSSRLDDSHLTKNGDGYLKLRDTSGRIVRTKDGQPVIKRGHTARGSLHQDTFYGLICKDGKMRYVVRKPVTEVTADNLVKIVDEDLRETFRQILSHYPSINAAIEAEGGIWHNDGKFPVRHVRMYARVVNAIALKPHRERSDFEYKRSYYVTNDENDCMVIHHGRDGKATLEIVSNLDAVKHYRRTGRKIRPEKPGDQVIRKGTYILFFKESREELKTLPMDELSRRLHRIDGLGYQAIFRHHLDSGTKPVSGSWHPDGVTPPAFIQVYSKYGFAVEGQDFRISKTGNITFNF